MLARLLTRGAAACGAVYPAACSCLEHAHRHAVLPGRAEAHVVRTRPATAAGVQRQPLVRWGGTGGAVLYGARCMAWRGGAWRGGGLRRTPQSGLACLDWKDRLTGLLVHSAQSMSQARHSGVCPHRRVPHRPSTAGPCVGVAYVRRYDGRHPNPHAPRCLPCAMASEQLPTLAEVLSTPHMQVRGRAGRVVNARRETAGERFPRKSGECGFGEVRDSSI